MNANENEKKTNCRVGKVKIREKLYNFLRLIQMRIIL